MSGSGLQRVHKQDFVSGPRPIPNSLRDRENGIVRNERASRAECHWLARCLFTAIPAAELRGVFASVGCADEPYQDEIIGNPL